MKDVLYVDPTLCQACGRCVEECVHHLVVPDGTHVDHSHPYCERCLHCYAVCSADAIKLSDSYSSLDHPAAWRDITPDTMESFLAYRRSTRRFKQKPVPGELIAQVVNAGRYIPSGGNRHPYEFTVLTDPKVKHALLDEFSRYYDRIRNMMGNPVIKAFGGLFLNRADRAFLNDPEYARRMKGLLDRFHEGDDPVFYNAPTIIIIHTQELIPTPQEDSLLAGFAMVLMAETLGLGTCFVSLAHKGFNANKRCKTLTGMTPEDQVHAVILLGYPDVLYHRPAPKPQKEIHYV